MEYFLTCPIDFKFNLVVLQLSFLLHVLILVCGKLDFKIVKCQNLSHNEIDAARLWF